MQTSNSCTNTGKSVLGVLRAKYPMACDPLAGSINAYPSQPQYLLTNDMT